MDSPCTGRIMSISFLPQTPSLRRGDYSSETPGQSYNSSFSLLKTKKGRSLISKTPALYDVVLHFLFLTIVEIFGVLVLFSDAAHDIGHPIFDLLLHALDAFLLLIGQVEARIQCVGTAAIYLDELLVLEELLFRDEAGAGGEVLLGSIIVSGEVVTVGHSLAVVIPIPGDKLDSVFAVRSGQHRSIEVGQHSVVTS